MMGLECILDEYNITF